MSDQVYLQKSTPSVGFRHTFGAVATHPWRTLATLEQDKHALLKGIWALLLVLVVYTIVLGIFILRGYPAASPAVLPVSVDELYQLQIWYQGPVFFFCSLATAGLLVLCARAVGESADYCLAFVRVCFASTVPFSLTMMLVEAVIALLVLFNVVQPIATLNWLRGDGAWFANTYQIIAGVWITALFMIVARQTMKRHWGISILVGLAALIVYATPVGLFIR